MQPTHYTIIPNPTVKARSPKTFLMSSENFISGAVGARYARTHYLSGNGIRANGVDPRTPEGVAALPEWHRRALDRVSEEKRAAWIEEKLMPERGMSVFVRTLQLAYAEHLPLALRPETLWSIVGGEVAQYVKDHASDPAVSAVFGVSDPNAPKRHIEVRVNDFVYGSPANDWLRGIELFRGELEKITPSGLIGGLCPELSTATPTTRVALLVTAMDAASPYTSYGMTTCCGIPSIRVEGTEEDWSRLAHHAAEIGRLFPGLSLYGNHVSGLFEKIAGTVRAAGNVDENTSKWWREIFKEDGGSGGPYLGGWFNGLYAHRYGWRGPRLKEEFEPIPRGMGSAPTTSNFPINLSKVEFAWNYYGREIPMMFVSGIAEADFDETGYLTPRLSVAVVELSPEETEAKEPPAETTPDTRDPGYGEILAVREPGGSGLEGGPRR